jgi:aminoglycoside phosphotransferase (APT) family kinase protein
MQTRPVSFSDETLSEALRAGWAMKPTTLAYLPVGFGSHHWRVHSDGADWFVTVDDLSARLHSAAASLDDAYNALRAALATASAVRAAGMAFAVAPRPGSDGEVLQRVEGRYAVAVYPWVDGRARGFGDELRPRDRAEIVDLLVQLHATPPETRAQAHTDLFQIASRAELESAMEDSHGSWETGPYGERARVLLAEHAGSIERLLARYDALAELGAADPDRMVLTHGEPHTGNLLETDDGWLLVDWDTALVAPPERDLWMHVEADTTVTGAYQQATGRRVQRDLLTLYRLRWLATDIALFVADFRKPHENTDDIRTSWAALQAYLVQVTDC